MPPKMTRIQKTPQHPHQAPPVGLRPCVCLLLTHVHQTTAKAMHGVETQTTRMTKNNATAEAHNAASGPSFSHTSALSWSAHDWSPPPLFPPPVFRVFPPPVFRVPQ